MTDSTHTKPQMSLQERVYRLVQTVPDETPIERFADQFLLSMIALSVLMFILATVPSLWQANQTLFKGFEAVAVTVFTIEYGMHLYACTHDPRYKEKGAFWGRIRYAFTFMMLVDLLAILPTYLTFLGSELAILRILRLFRLARILKVNRYSSALTDVQAAWEKKAPELAIAATLMLTLIIITSTLLFFVEESQHGGERFTSIPDTMWAAVAVVSPLGYDGYYPKTMMGRTLMMFISVFGVAFVALPAGIFAGAFATQLNASQEEVATEMIEASGSAELSCPHCGKLVKLHSEHTLV